MTWTSSSSDEDTHPRRRAPPAPSAAPTGASADAEPVAEESLLPAAAQPEQPEPQPVDEYGADEFDEHEDLPEEQTTDAPAAVPDIQAAPAPAAAVKNPRKKTPGALGRVNSQATTDAPAPAVYWRSPAFLSELKVYIGHQKVDKMGKGETKTPIELSFDSFLHKLGIARDALSQVRRSANDDFRMRLEEARKEFEIEETHVRAVDSAYKALRTALEREERVSFLERLHSMFMFGPRKKHAQIIEMTLVDDIIAELSGLKPGQSFVFMGGWEVGATVKPKKTSGGGNFMSMSEEKTKDINAVLMVIQAGSSADTFNVAVINCGEGVEHHPWNGERGRNRRYRTAISLEASRAALVEPGIWWFLLHLRLGTLPLAQGAQAFYEVLMPQLLGKDFSVAVDDSAANHGRWERVDADPVACITSCYDFLLSSAGISKERREQLWHVKNLASLQQIYDDLDSTVADFHDSDRRIIDQFCSVALVDACQASTGTVSAKQLRNLRSATDDVLKKANAIEIQGNEAFEFPTVDFESVARLDSYSDFEIFQRSFASATEAATSASTAGVDAAAPTTSFVNFSVKTEHGGAVKNFDDAKAILIQLKTTCVRLHRQAESSEGAAQTLPMSQLCTLVDHVLTRDLPVPLPRDSPFKPNDSCLWQSVHGMPRADQLEALKNLYDIALHYAVARAYESRPTDQQIAKATIINGCLLAIFDAVARTHDPNASSDALPLAQALCGSGTTASSGFWMSVCATDGTSLQSIFGWQNIADPLLLVVRSKLYRYLCPDFAEPMPKLFEWEQRERTIFIELPVEKKGKKESKKADAEVPKIVLTVSSLDKVSSIKASIKERKEFEVDTIQLFSPSDLKNGLDDDKALESYKVETGDTIVLKIRTEEEQAAFEKAKKMAKEEEEKKKLEEQKKSEASGMGSDGFAMCWNAMTSVESKPALEKGQVGWFPVDQDATVLFVEALHKLREVPVEEADDEEEEEEEGMDLDPEDLAWVEDYLQQQRAVMEQEGYDFDRFKNVPDAEDNAFIRGGKGAAGKATGGSGIVAIDKLLAQYDINKGNPLVKWIQADWTHMPEVALYRDMLMLFKLGVGRRQANNTINECRPRWSFASQRGGGAVSVGYGATAFQPHSDPTVDELFSGGARRLRGIVERKPREGQEQADITAEEQVLVRRASNATETDVLFTQDIGKLGLESLASLEEQEQLAVYLTCPQLAVPLVMRFFASRISALMNADLCRIFECVLFETRDFRTSITATVVPTESADIGTEFGVLMNEVLTVPSAVFESFLEICKAATDLCGKREYTSVFVSLFLNVTEMACKIEQCAQTAIASSGFFAERFGHRERDGDLQRVCKEVEVYLKAVRKYLQDVALPTIREWLVGAEDDGDIVSAVCFHSYLIQIAAPRLDATRGDEVSSFLCSVGYIMSWKESKQRSQRKTLGPEHPPNMLSTVLDCVQLTRGGGGEVVQLSDRWPDWTAQPQAGDNAGAFSGGGLPKGLPGLGRAKDSGLSSRLESGPFRAHDVRMHTRDKSTSISARARPHRARELPGRRLDIGAVSSWDILP